MRLTPDITAIQCIMHCTSDRIGDEEGERLLDCLAKPSVSVSVVRRDNHTLS